MTFQHIGKYARLEVEGRYLLSSLPAGLLDQPEGWTVTDRYFPHTRLRLRRMESLSGQGTIYKLTQKYRSETQDAYEATVTNQYLTESEYRFFEALEAGVLRKRRYSYPFQNHSFSIDVFDGRHQGLILAEKEFDTREEVDGFGVPAFALKEVTCDPFFTGGCLVAMSGEEFAQCLSQHLRGGVHP